MEIAFDLHLQWITCAYEIVEDDIDDMLVKDLHFAKRIDIELQTFQFNAALVWRVLQTNRGKVWKIREGTNASELGDVELDFDLATGKLVSEGVERIEIHLRARRRADVEALLIWW